MNFQVNETAATATQVTAFENPFINPGFNKVQIIDFIMKKSNAGDKAQLSFVFQSEPVASESFKNKYTDAKQGTVLGVKTNEKCKGGLAAYGIYADYTTQEAGNIIASDLFKIANTCGKGVEFKAVMATATSVEDLIKKTIEVIKGCYIWLQFNASEYTKADGKIGTSLKLATFPYTDPNSKIKSYVIITFSVEDVISCLPDKEDGNKQVLTFKEGANTKTKIWDKNNKYDYEKVAPVAPDSDDIFAGTSGAGLDVDITDDLL